MKKSFIALALLLTCIQVNAEDNKTVQKPLVLRAETNAANMEMVVFALKKADGEDAIPVPLYNATAVTVGDQKSSTLKIWRKSKKSGAQKIIAKIEKDLDEAKEEYDFIAASDGFAQWPDFVGQQNTVKK